MGIFSIGKSFKESLALLRELEYPEIDPSGNYGGHRCKFCKGYDPEDTCVNRGSDRGHYPECRLGVFLGKWT